MNEWVYHKDYPGLRYSPQLGNFQRYFKSFDEWREVGYISDRGYIRIKYNHKTLRAHRIAWFMMTGQTPSDVDHINHNTLDNRFTNLRGCTHSQNLMNMKHRNVHKGITVKFRKDRGKVYYYCHITCEGKDYSTCTPNLEKALEWRVKKEKELFGEFAYNGK